MKKKVTARSKVKVQSTQLRGMATPIKDDPNLKQVIKLLEEHASMRRARRVIWTRREISMLAELIEADRYPKAAIVRACKALDLFPGKSQSAINTTVKALASGDPIPYPVED